MKEFIKTIDVPLIKRGYSPEVVFDMSTKIDHLLPESLKFKSNFKYLGMLTHESIREYGCSIIKHIVKISSHELFDNLKLNRLNKIDNMNNIIGWPSDKKLGGYTFSSKYSTFVLSEKDNHPNRIGQQFIAEEIYNKYIKVYKGEPCDKNDIPC
jgi:hypothetical protein